MLGKINRRFTQPKVQLIKVSNHLKAPNSTKKHHTKQAENLNTEFSEAKEISRKQWTNVIG